MLGPAVSLNGSPTVSPVTAALCASEFFPPCAPVSTNFLALSHAPPAVLRNSAIRIPATVANMSMPATAFAPSSSCPVAAPTARNATPITTGPNTANKPGLSISRSALSATMATHRE